MAPIDDNKTNDLFWGEVLNWSREAGNLPPPYLALDFPLLQPLASCLIGGGTDALLQARTTGFQTRLQSEKAEGLAALD